MSDADPPRLKDDPAMSEALRRDLDSVSTSAHSTPFDVESGLVRLRAAIATGGGPGGYGGGGTTAPAGPMASGLSGAAVAAIVVVGLLPLGAVIALVVMAREPAPAPEIRDFPHRTISAPVPERVPMPVRSASDPREAPTRPAASAPVPAPIEPAARATNDDQRAQSHERGRESPHQRVPDDSVRREIEHMTQLRRALRSDPSRALALANAGQQEFRHGQLVEEREAIAVLALARLGRRAELDRRGTRFLRRYPRSAFAERIERQLRQP